MSVVCDCVCVSDCVMCGCVCVMCNCVCDVWLCLWDMWLCLWNVQAEIKRMAKQLESALHEHQCKLDEQKVVVQRQVPHMRTWLGHHFGFRQQ